MKTVCLFVMSLITLHSFSQNKKKVITPVLPLASAKVVYNPDSVFAEFTTEKSRTNYYRTLVSDDIQKNLSTILTDSAAENKWQKAFTAMERVQYKSPWVSNRLHEASDKLIARGISFQQAFIELVYGMYPGEYPQQVISVFETTEDAKTFILCAEYLLQDNNNDHTKRYIQTIYNKKTRPTTFIAACKPLLDKFQEAQGPVPPIRTLLHAKFFEGSVIVFSIQRKNRDYPGIVVIRLADGKFYRNSNKTIYHLPQLARTITKLPYYVNNGNPPQGIYKIKGYDTTYNDMYSGPTESIELAMPFQIKVAEYSPKIKNSVPWHIAYYRTLLPLDWQTYSPIYEAFYTGLGSHNRVLAQGSTINADYYKGKPYYPLTPSTGGLTTKESWGKADGRRVQSDQWSLVSTLKKIAGPYAYYVIVEIDDKQAAVTMEDIVDGISFAEGLN